MNDTEHDPAEDDAGDDQDILDQIQALEEDVRRLKEAGKEKGEVLLSRLRHQFRRSAEEKREQAEEAIGAHPWWTVGGAAAAGFVLAMLLRR